MNTNYKLDYKGRRQMDMLNQREFRKNYIFNLNIQNECELDSKNYQLTAGSN